MDGQELQTMNCNTFNYDEKAKNIMKRMHSEWFNMEQKTMINIQI